jgi:hypothetical protein
MARGAGPHQHLFSGFSGVGSGLQILGESSIEQHCPRHEGAVVVLRVQQPQGSRLRTHDGLPPNPAPVVHPPTRGCLAPPSQPQQSSLRGLSAEDSPARGHGRTRKGSHMRASRAPPERRHGRFRPSQPPPSPYVLELDRILRRGARSRAGVEEATRSGGPADRDARSLGHSQCHAHTCGSS